MKTQHQIIVKRQRPSRPRTKDPAVLQPKKRKPTDIIAAGVSIGERELNFARALSDTEKHVRDAALSSLKDWLRTNAQNLKAGEIDRLWKALFYCIWMADKRNVITAVIRDIVALSDIVGWPLLQGMFDCMMREWSGIDRHRVDKFYELISEGLAKAVSRVVVSPEQEDFRSNVTFFVSFLQGCVIDKAQKGGKGVALHVLDCYIDAVLFPLLERSSKLPGNQVHWAWDQLLEPLYALLGPEDGRLIAIAGRTRERVMSRLPDVVRDERLNLPDKAQRDMIQRSSKRVFAIAAAKDTPIELRSALYILRTDLKTFVFQYQETVAAAKSEDVQNDAE